MMEDIPEKGKAGAGDMPLASEKPPLDSAPSPAPSPAPKGDADKKWYIVHAHSNFEGRVRDTIEERSVSQGLADRFEEVLVPVEEVVEMRRGQKKIVKRKFFPGYVLVKMKMDERTHHLIRNVPKVSGFLGAEKPTPISEAEAQRILGQIKEGVEAPRPSITFEVGEQVRVADGPFASFNGVVEDVDLERSRLKVSVSIFGRATPMDLEYSQVEKS